MEYPKVVVLTTLLAVVYAGVQHYTKHHCIAFAAVSALIFLAGALK